MKRTERTQLGIRLPTELHEALKGYSEETGVPMTRLVTDALRALLKERTGKEV